MKNLFHIIIVTVLTLIISITYAQNQLPNIADKFAHLSPVHKKLAEVIDSYFLKKIIEMENNLDFPSKGKIMINYSDQAFIIDDNNRVRVKVGVPNITSEYSIKLKNLGFEILHENIPFHRYDGWLPIDKIYDFTNLNFVNFIKAATLPNFNVTTQGDVLHRSNLVREEFSNVNGSGIKVGIISDDVDHLQEVINAGELPQSTTIVHTNTLLFGDEGTAMLEIVHDIAPASSLYFSTAGLTEEDMSQHILDLKNQGCNIICDDMYFYGEPEFEEGIISQTINSFTTNNNGVYITSAGNEGNQIYFGDFIDNGDNWCRFLIPGGYTTFLPLWLPHIGVLDPPYRIWLNWNERFGLSNTDYDLYLFDKNFNLILSSTAVQNGNDDPNENIFGFNILEGDTVYVAVKRADNSPQNIRKLKLTFFGIYPRGGWEMNTFSITGHANSNLGLSIGAIQDANNLELLSSQGPAYIYSYDSQGNPTSFEERLKPNLVALDGVQTYTGQQHFSNFSNPFYGTSAAAPHVAGIAALIWSGGYQKSNADVLNSLLNSAVELGSNSPNFQYGYGRVDALNAFSSLLGPVLQSPNNNSTINILNPTFQWYSQTGTTAYQLEIATDYNFNEVVFSEGNIQGTNKQVNNLINNTIYFWRVRGLFDFGYGPYSEKWILNTNLLNSLYAGSVAPQSGSTLDNFNFTVTYKSTGNVPPDNVQLHIINQFTDNMTANGSNWQQGVQFTKTLNNFAVGQYEYYFTASVNGQQLRFPEAGNLNFNVTQNVAGWDLWVSNFTYSPTIVTPGSNFSATGSVTNNSNSPDKIYNNVDYSFTFYDPSGNLVGTPQTGTFSQIIQGQTVTVTKSFTAPSSQGNCQLVFTVYPGIDGNTSNNSLTKTVIVSETGSQNQWLISNSNYRVNMNNSYPIHPFMGHTYELKLANNTTIDIKREDRPNPDHIAELNLRKYDGETIVVLNEQCSTGNAYVSFGSNDLGTVSYEATKITTNPGTTIEFIATSSGSQFYSAAPIIFNNNDGATIASWYNSYTRFNNNYSIRYAFNVPSNAGIDTYQFYLYSRLSSGDRFLIYLEIQVVAAPPYISSISSNYLSANDQITITGTNFGSTTGSVKFNNLSGSIVSWNNPVNQIKVIVPEGVQSGNIIVTNANGPSNGMAYTVKSSTGAPVVIAPIPDQSIYQGETKLIASLNNVFSEPNNQVMTFSATSSNPDVIVDQNLLTTGQLSLTALANATGTATITVTATDPNNKTASDEFLITIIPTQQSFITLTSPNGGEVWTIGSPQNITWVSNGTSGNVKIEISRDNGVNWDILFANTPDDETKNWTVTGPLTTLCKIKISDLDGNPLDVSDNTFNIIVQNVSPILTWTSETGYENDGVNPNAGTTSTQYTFKVKYTDADGDAPLSGYPKLHIKKGGVEITNSPFVMNEVVMNGPEGKMHNKETDEKQKSLKDGEKSKRNEDEVILPDNPIVDGYLEGVIYEYSIGTLEAGSDYTYYFEARDVNNNLAIGEATIEKTGPFVTELFTDLNLPNLPGTYNGDAIWGDYDNDGDLDILLTGAGVMSIYSNDGNETFNFVNISSFELFQVCSADWGDYDNDGDLDILVAGYSAQFGYKSIVYKNNGSNNFVNINAGLIVLAYGAAKWSDYDNDGDLDITLTGNGTSMIPTTRIYKNDGADVFTLISSPNITNVTGSSCDWGDYDNDKDIDLLISGRVSGSEIVTIIHRNDGGGNFTKMDAIGLTGGWKGSVEWGDYDGDGDLDILFTGANTANAPQTHIYRNDGNNTFEEISLTSIPQLTDSDTDWGDFDNDGDLDFILSGWDGSNEITRLYRNEGNDNFVGVTDASFIDLRYSSVNWGDFDNDGDLDLLLNGYNSTTAYSKVYRNNTSVINDIPAVPDNLSANIISSNEVELNWSKVSNDETSSNGLTYNLVVGTTPGGNEIVSPMANRVNGNRRIPDLGNANHNNRWNIKDLEPGTYYWSVQAIDNCLKGSQFATEQSFIITETNPPEYWTSQTSNTNHNLQSVYFVNDQVGWATGTGTGSVVFHTTNGGETWSGTNFTNSSLYGIHFLNDQIGWVCGFYSDVNQNGSIWKTTNGGQSWSGNIPVYHTGDIYDVFFNNANLGWAVGEDWGSPSGFLVKSTDGGANWTKIALPYTGANRLSKIFFLNENRGWAVGSGGYVIGTSDGGNTWSVLEDYNSSLPAWKGIYFIDEQNGYAVGSNGSIGKTTNAGSSWAITNWPTTSLNNIQFTDNTRGWIVGTNGTILKTTNGGISWNGEQSGTTESLNCVHFPVQYKGWAVGNNGTILQYYNSAAQSLAVNLKVFLEGPYNGSGLMTTTLNTNNLIPLNSDIAYPTVTYGYTASVVGSIPNSSIVDWVLLELRTGTSSGTKVATRAAFLKSDGTIVGIDGTSPVTFTGLMGGNYYIVVRHRNHLPIMTASAIPLSNTAELYDFTTSQLQAYTSATDPMVVLSDGGFGMIAGDGNNSAIITAADVTPIINFLNNIVYNGADVNMSAIVTAADVNKIISNLNKAINVPN